MQKRELEHRLEKLFSPSVESDSPDQRGASDSDAAPRLPENGAGASGFTRQAGAAGVSAELGFLKAVIDRIPDPVFIKDRDHKWVFVNSAFCELIGQSESSLLGRTDRDYSAEDRSGAAWALDNQVLETGQPCAIEESIASADGQVRVRSTHRQLLRDESGQPYVLGIVQDITGLKRAEMALQENERQRRADRERWEGKLRKLKRGLLFQFTFFGLVAGLSVSVFVAAREPEPPGKVYAGVSDQAVAATPTPALVEIAATRAPATAVATAAPSPTPTLTVYRLIVSLDPTVAPYGVADSSAIPPTPAPLRDFGPNVINVVLMGSDRRPGDGAWRTDVLILASIDTDAPSVALLSFPRDLWVYIPGWRWQRINLADERGESSGFPGGGPALVKQTIQYNFGIPVHYYARVDFRGYRRLIDALGGVDVVADCTLYDIFPDVPDGQNDILSGPALSTVPTGTIDIPIAGVYHLDGKHALWYARSRRTTSDFDRSRRQHRVLRAVWDAIRDQGLVSRLPQLWDSLTQTVETDLGLNDLIYLADVRARTSPMRIHSRFIDGSMLAWHVTETGASVLRYTYEDVASYLDEVFAPPPANIASQPPARIGVLNGTARADWERVAADRLGRAGFSVSDWRRTDAPYPHTTIIDFTLTSKGSHLPALAELFQVAPENLLHRPDPSSPVSYRIIVGDDFEPCQRPSR